MESDFDLRVLDVVERIPRGRVLAYGDVADLLGDGGPRRVARTLSRHGAGVPWHRVLRADGSSAPEVAGRQIPLLRAEGVPFRPAADRVDMTRARWDGTTAAAR